MNKGILVIRLSVSALKLFPTVNLKHIMGLISYITFVRLSPIHSSVKKKGSSSINNTATV